MNPSTDGNPATATGDGPPLVAILGRVTIHSLAGPQPVTARLNRAVLVQLTLARRRPIPVDVLTDAVWSGHPPPEARNALQVKVSRLRRMLGDHAGRLEFVHGCYRLRLDPIDTDLGRLTDGIERAESALKGGDHGGAAAVLAPLLDSWWGAPLAEFAADPRVVAELAGLEELHATAIEANAEAQLADQTTRSKALAELRGLLERDPMRPRARRLLMLGLEASGRRADALAVYDAGRRLVNGIGLDPPPELEAAFRRLLDAERRRTRRTTTLRAHKSASPDSLLETVRWLADDGDVPGALQLGVRGAWWWWSSGRRGPAHEILNDLLERSEGAGTTDLPAHLTAQAWLGVFGSTTARAALNLAIAERALMAATPPRWTRNDALAAVLVAERLFDRGDPSRAGRLLALAARRYEDTDDRHGRAVCATVGARGQLLAGAVVAAEHAANAAHAQLQGLGDTAGQLMALDTLGYCAEVRGHLDRAERLHLAALTLARRNGSPEWEAAQLTRLGSVRALAGSHTAADDLAAATSLSAETGSQTVAALARNALGVALALSGDGTAATREHLAAWAYYTEAGSRAGLAYTGARLAIVQPQPDSEADRWATESLHLALASKDPRAVAHSLEAIALVRLDDKDATRALAAASALRSTAAAPLPALQQQPLTRRRRLLFRTVGADAFEKLSGEAAAKPWETAASW